MLLPFPSLTGSEGESLKQREAWIGIGLGYGDESKGSWVDWAVRQFDTPPTVVRFNGGPQAAHNVVLPDDRHHTFASFGSGTFAGAKTHLSKHVLVNPLALFAEEAHLAGLGVTDALGRLSIHADCKIITPYHKALNRARENARTDRHGSCGHGVGETMRQHEEHPELTLTASNVSQVGLQKIRRYCRDLVADIDPQSVELKIFGDVDIYDSCVSAYTDLFDGRLVDDGWEAKYLLKQNLIFEGAQGVLLDEWFGFHPYTTWSTTTFENAMDVLQDYTGEITKVGITRTYLTRHGPGPFVTEDTGLTIPEAHNAVNGWQGHWRTGWPDLVALRYAVESCGGIDKIAISHADRTPTPLKVCTSYSPYSKITPGSKYDLESQELETKRLLSCSPVYEETDDPLVVADGHPIQVVSYGPTWEDKVII